MAGYDVTEPVVFDLGSSIASVYLATDVAWDCSVGGLPFLFATAADRPLVRESAPFRTDRVDQQREPGEQSLDSSYWLRSFSSLHYGAGLRDTEALVPNDSLSETRTYALSRFRFYKSASLDVWTPGEVKPTLGVTTLRSTAATHQAVIGIGSGNTIHATDATLSEVSSTGTVTAITWGGTSNIESITTDGTNWYAGNNTDGIYKGALPSGAGAKVYNGGGAVTVRWCKQRLMAAVGVSLYELVAAGPALPTALFTHPNTAWTWTDIAEGPQGFYFSGYAGDTSAIYHSSISVSGATVTTNTPVVVAELPRGETVLSLYGYLGTYLAIGTNRGFRVAEFQSDGSLTVGPLIFTCQGGCYDQVGYDRFLYVTGGSLTSGPDNGDAPGIYRVDLSVDLERLRFAYAQECVGAGSSAPSSVTYSGSQLVYSVPGTGLVAQASDGSYATEAWVQFSKVGYSTTENKAWRAVLLRADVPTGCSVEVYADAEGSGNPSTWAKVGTLTSSATDGEFSLSLPAPNPQRSMFIALRLLGTTTARPTVYGLTLRAVPAPKRTRLMQVSLMCYDFERDRNGQRVGTIDGAWARLQALESAEELGQVVTYQDFTTGERRVASIEKVSFARTTPPSRANDNTGGVLTLTLRLL